jgi:hypothetical protein
VDEWCRGNTMSRTPDACWTAEYGKMRAARRTGTTCNSLCTRDVVKPMAEGRPCSPPTHSKAGREGNYLNDQDRNWNRKRHTSNVSNLANSGSTRSLMPLPPSLTIAQILLPITSLVPSQHIPHARRRHQEVPWDDNSAQNSNGSIGAPPRSLT